MRPELQRLAEDLRETRATIASLDDTARPATNGWTVAQVLEHLTKVHETMVPRFEATLQSAPALVGSESVRPSMLDRMVIPVIGGNSPLKIPVPPMFEPGPAGPDAKAACLASIDALLAVLEKADDRALAGLRVATPINARIKLGLLPYLDGLVQHARYHTKQTQA